MLSLQRAKDRILAGHDPKTGLVTTEKRDFPREANLEILIGHDKIERLNLEVELGGQKAAVVGAPCLRNRRRNHNQIFGQTDFLLEISVRALQGSRIWGGMMSLVQSKGLRRALCVGIDEYVRAPLFGCVADTRMWENALLQLGFERLVMLLNGQATRDAIERNLHEMVQSSNAGDVIVFQYSGHGTQLPDLDGDEAAGDTPGQDEALCPFDYDTGAFLIDDDVGGIFSLIPKGVNLTCFMDCCHSGTITRFAVEKTPGSERRETNLRPRFMTATADMIAAHERFRSIPGGRPNTA